MLSRKLNSATIQPLAVLLMASLGPGLLPGCNVDATPDPNELMAYAGADRFTGADETLTLSASATGGSGPYLFRWNIEVVPDGDEIQPIPDGDQQVIETLPFVVGRYVYRVQVTDAAGNIDVDFVTIEVGQSFGVSILTEDGQDGETLAPSANEPFTLTAEPNRSGDFRFSWTRISGVEIEFSADDAESTDVTALASGEVVIRLDVTDLESGLTAGDEITLFVVDEDRPRVIMTVESSNEGVQGDIVFELLADAAPETVANLLRYIGDDFYDGIIWHRVANNPDGSPFVVQAGGFTRDGETLVRKEPTFDPVESEADNGVSNLPGTVAMALFGNDPDSGTTQFFVNLNDNSFLDEAFTVFARVVQGMDIIDAMAEVETGITNVQDAGPLSDVPVSDITIVSFRLVVAPASDGGD